MRFDPNLHPDPKLIGAEEEVPIGPHVVGRIRALPAPRSDLDRNADASVMRSLRNTADDVWDRVPLDETLVARATGTHEGESARGDHGDFDRRVPDCDNLTRSWHRESDGCQSGVEH